MASKKFWIEEKEKSIIINMMIDSMLKIQAKNQLPDFIGNVHLYFSNDTWKINCNNCGNPSEELKIKIIGCLNLAYANGLRERTSRVKISKYSLSKNEKGRVDFHTKLNNGYCYTDFFYNSGTPSDKLLDMVTHALYFAYFDGINSTEPTTKEPP